MESNESVYRWMDWELRNPFLCLHIRFNIYIRHSKRKENKELGSFLSCKSVGWWVVELGKETQFSLHHVHCFKSKSFKYFKLLVYVCQGWGEGMNWLWIDMDVVGLTPHTSSNTKIAIEYFLSYLQVNYHHPHAPYDSAHTISKINVCVCRKLLYMLWELPQQ